MEVKEEPIKEEPEKKPTGDKPKSIIPYMDKIRIRELYGYDWTKFDIAGNLSEAQKTDLTDGGATTLHKHDHGDMDGLDGDDHTQYHNDARGDARYYTETEVDNFAVKLTGDQTIAGVKTFSSFPVTPSSSPTTDYQVCNKKYADDIVGGITNVAIGNVASFTPADNDTTDLTIGFTPKIIIFYAATTNQSKHSSGTSKGTGASDSVCRWVDPLDTGDTSGSEVGTVVIHLMDGGSGLIQAKVTTFGSTTTLTWEVITPTAVQFCWTALA